MRSAAGYLNDGSFAKAVPHAVRVRNSFSSTAARMLAFTGNQLYTIPAIYRFRADSGSHLLRVPNGCSGRAAAAFRRCRVRMVGSVCRTLHAGMLPADGEVLQLRSALQAYAAAAEREAAQAARYGALVFETCTDAYVPDADLIENQSMIPDMSRVLLRLAVKKLVPFQDRVISEQTLRQLLRIPAWNPCLKRSARIWTTRRIACGSWRRFCLTERFRSRNRFQHLTMRSICSGRATVAALHQTQANALAGALLSAAGGSLSSARILLYAFAEQTFAPYTADQ